MNVEAVTFDATGTLFHCPSLPKLYAESLARHGVHITQAEVSRWFPIAWQESDCRVSLGGDRFADHPRGERGFWEDLINRICLLAGQPAPGAFAVAELFQVFARGSSWQVFPEVREVLKDLNSLGLRLAVISNWDRRLGPLLDDLGLGKFFDSVHTSSAIGHAKPDRRIFLAATEQFQLAPVQVLHVGDHRVQDFEGAAAAGLQSFLVDRDRRIDLTHAAARARGARL